MIKPVAVSKFIKIFKFFSSVFKNMQLSANYSVIVKFSAKFLKLHVNSKTFDIVLTVWLEIIYITIQPYQR